MIHAPGIYFGLSESEYHADVSLSTSGIKKLLEGPEEWWWQSHLNPARPAREVKDCLARGTLWHCRILEPENFDLKYILAPALTDDFASGRPVLRTVSDMKEWLDDNMVPYKKSMLKDELVDIIRLYGQGPDAPYLYDFETARFVEDHREKTVIYSRDVYDDMLDAEGAILSHPEYSKVFAGGMSEVSIFWIDEESGIPMKARIDKLKARAILDYKTIHVPRGKGLKKAALSAIKFEHYDLQVAVYTLAVAHAVNMINAGTGIIHGEVPGSFIDEFRQQPEKLFGFVFQQEERPNAIRGLKVVRNRNDTFNVFGAGLVFMQEGIQLYQRYMELFGTEKRWFDPSGMTDLQDHEIYYS